MAGCADTSTSERRDASDVVTIVAHDVGGTGGMERQLEALITSARTRHQRSTVVSRTLELPPHPQLRWRRVPGPARPSSSPTLVRARRVADADPRQRGVLHTTGAIVFNRADVCTVHYVHNGRSRSVRRMQRVTSRTG